MPNLCQASHTSHHCASPTSPLARAGNLGTMNNEMPLCRMGASAFARPGRTSFAANHARRRDKILVPVFRKDQSSRGTARFLENPDGNRMRLGSSTCEPVQYRYSACSGTASSLRYCRGADSRRANRLKPGVHAPRHSWPRRSFLPRPDQAMPASPART